MHTRHLNLPPPGSYSVSISTPADPWVRQNRAMALLKITEESLREQAGDCVFDQGSYGGPEVLTVTELPDPVPAAGEVLIAVRAFGLNHAEAYMRSGAMGEVAKVTGIECAGTVVADPSGRLAGGTAVVAILGGMGRTRNGSYAELVTVPASNVVQVSTSLPWTDLVALPEVYATAWAGLRQNLDLRPGQTILIRGAALAGVLPTWPSAPAAACRQAAAWPAGPGRRREGRPAGPGGEEAILLINRPALPACASRRAASARSASVNSPVQVGCPISCSMVSSGRPRITSHRVAASS